MKGIYSISFYSIFLLSVLDIYVFSSPALISPLFWLQYTLCFWKDRSKSLFPLTEKYQNWGAVITQTKISAVDSTVRQ